MLLSGIYNGALPKIFGLSDVTLVNTITTTPLVCLKPVRLLQKSSNAKAGVCQNKNFEPINASEPSNTAISASRARIHSWVLPLL